MTLLTHIPPAVWQLTIVGEELGRHWDLTDEDALMDALVQIAEHEAAKQIDDPDDYEAYNDLTLAMANDAAKVLLSAGECDPRSEHEPWLWPNYKARADIGSRTVEFMQFARRSASC